MGYLDLETNFEDAAKTFLETATGLSASSLYASLDQDTFVSPRLSIRAEIGSAEDPPTVVSGDVLEYTQYNLNLSISIVSDAAVSGTQTNHRSYREKVREAMLLNAANWTSKDDNDDPILPFYEVKYMRPSGSDFEVDGDLAISTLTFEIKFTIKPSYFGTTSQSQSNSTGSSSTSTSNSATSSSTSATNSSTSATSSSTSATSSSTSATNSSTSATSSSTSATSSSTSATSSSTSSN